MNPPVDQGLLTRVERLGDMREREYWGRYQALTEPYHRAIEQLRTGELSAADDALRYLETRPRFHGSGYLAGKLIKVLSQTELPERVEARFHAALSMIVAEKPSTRERGIAQRILDKASR